MPNKLQELASSIITQIKEIAASDTVVGKQVIMGTKSVVPVTRVTVGFGVGGGEGEKGDAESGFGGGAGGGVRVEPMGFIIIEEDKVSFLPTGRTKYEGLIAAVPDLITRIKEFKKGDKKDSKGKTRGQSETQDSPGESDTP
jgi:uncharacterized spore protein YtfJ